MLNVAALDQIVLIEGVRVEDLKHFLLVFREFESNRKLAIFNDTIRFGLVLASFSLLCLFSSQLCLVVGEPDRVFVVLQVT